MMILVKIQKKIEINVRKKADVILVNSEQALDSESVFRFVLLCMMWLDGSILESILMKLYT